MNVSFFLNHFEGQRAGNIGQGARGKDKETGVRDFGKFFAKDFVRDLEDAINTINNNKKYPCVMPYPQ